MEIVKDLVNATRAADRPPACWSDEDNQGIPEKAAPQSRN
jgi:hypothetical protein